MACFVCWRPTDEALCAACRAILDVPKLVAVLTRPPTQWESEEEAAKRRLRQRALAAKWRPARQP